MAVVHATEVWHAAPDAAARRAGPWLPTIVIGSALAAPVAAGIAHRAWGLTLPQSGWSLAWPLVLAPLIEEALFRAIQFETGLRLERRWRATTSREARRRRADAWAAVCATLVFVAAHGAHAAGSQPWLLAAWLAPGAALALTWTWRKRWRDCILLHAWFNGCLWLAGTA